MSMSLFLALILATASGWAQQPVHDNPLVTVFKLTDFIDWPEQAFGAGSPGFNFCLLGTDSGVYAEDNGDIPQRVSGHLIEFRRVHPGEIGGCHILYIARLDPDISTVLQAPPRYTLTVSSQPGFSELGGAIQLDETVDRVGLTVNPSVTRRAGLNVRSGLLQIARIVGPHPQDPNSQVAALNPVALPETPSPALVRRVPPVYPKQALKRRIEGFVEARIQVDAEGRVQDVEVLRSEPSSVFNKEAIRALKKWKFESVSDRNFVASRNVTQMIRFKLRK